MAQTTLLTLTSSSNDANNHNLSSTTELLTVDSMTAAGVTISQCSLTLTESGSSVDLSFVLNTPPSGNVTISLTDNDSSELSYSLTSLSFDNLSWMNAQTVSFSAIEDAIVDGDQTVNLSVGVSSSPAGMYDNTMNTSVGISVVDSGLTPPSTPVLDNATSGVQLNTVYWQAQSSVSSFTLYWTDDNSDPSTSSDNITISDCLLYTSPSPRDGLLSRMPSSA